MKVGSLFSGIGGLDLGLERAGMEIVWQVENDDFCRRVLAKHWPNVPCYEDIRELDGSTLAPVDLICGGFPCQPTSHAGRRRGEEDDRWLWPEMLRIIREVKPAFVLGENVYGLVTHDGGVLLASVQTDLEDAGYEVAPAIVFPAAAVGALHRRDRVWICAYARHHDRRPEQGQQQEERADILAGVRGKAELRGTVANPGWLGYGQSQTSVLTRRAGLERYGGWSTEPDVGRVAYGVPSRVDRIRALGNAVVPQCAELIGRQLMEVLHDHG